MAFADELAALGERVTLVPQDEVGLIDLDGALRFATPGTAVYCCGPEPLLRAVEAACATRPDLTLHVERFAPKEIDAAPLQDTFEVELARTGVTVTVGPDTSILEAATEAGAAVVSSCEEGICGTCETRIVSGEADHRDSVLTSAEQQKQDVMMICVSRSACPRLVLDL
jgi:ferredoxin